MPTMTERTGGSPPRICRPAALKQHEHLLADAGAHRVDRDHILACIAAHHQHAVTIIPRVMLIGHHRADHLASSMDSIDVVDQPDDRQIDRHKGRIMRAQPRDFPRRRRAARVR